MIFLGAAEWVDRVHVQPMSHVFRLNPNAKQQSSAKQLNLVEVVH